MMLWAPITWLVDFFTTDGDFAVLKALRPSSFCEELERIARAEIGNGESGGNNAGPSVDKYRADRGGSGAWCAAFVSWCALRAADERGHDCAFEPTNGARRLFRRAVRAGQLVKLRQIQKGDLVLWARGPVGGWQSHIGVVSAVIRDELGDVTQFLYIAGNEGRYPALVKERAGIHKARLVGFARV